MFPLREVRRMLSRTFSRSTDSVPTLATTKSEDAPVLASKRKLSTSDDDGDSAQPVKRAKNDVEDAAETVPPKDDASHKPENASTDASAAQANGADTSKAVSDASDAKVEDGTAEHANSGKGDEERLETPPPQSDEDAEEAEDEPEEAAEDGEVEDDDGFVFPTLDRKGPNVFFLWADAIIDIFATGGAEDPPVMWLKSQIMDAYGKYAGGGKKHKDVEADETIGYWGVTVDDDVLEASSTKKLHEAFREALKPLAGSDDGWWWEVTVVKRPVAASKPGLKVELESSQPGQDNDVWGGRKLGNWWITELKPATSKAAELMTFHRDRI